MSTASPEEEGISSGANNAIRELGGGLGVAVLTAVFSTQGCYRSGTLFVDGLARRCGSARVPRDGRGGRGWVRGAAPWHQECQCGCYGDRTLARSPQRSTDPMARPASR
jgi:hypothetical protein